MQAKLPPKLLLLILLAAGLGGALAGCGQKGPLYLPDAEPAQEEQTRAPQGSTQLPV